ncbi:molybdopterin molybdotransferase MoeA [Carboxydothermus hydrogenoformans]|uniref:Molybdopterin molybdenumtransferase n=1 Tax=Carboxydothermus hydrogenoformans (strain ATCC BAA-161 / DSM 6008 / Z-2901) TaxID=246194 RepID=Q3ADY2_CARHZ|nr:gephyrin-like molybdotransferase Glp [Carboxydothermus hydrogenoformans]ABB14091.1 putative molybdopterin biosynthesis moeA protein [Carboxydothermus hydrogenoformans Z-2901]
MKELLNLITPEEALKLLKSNFKVSLKATEIELSQAFGKILAEPVKALENIPPFSRSTVDGYAVFAEDTFGATETFPVLLKLKGEIGMGEVPEFALGPGEAVRIFTGGALPEGADSVVMVEHTELFDSETVSVLKPVAPGENVIAAGEDFKEGEVVLEKGTRIRPQELGVLAALGYSKVTVYNSLKVGIISTGDELVPVETKLKPGQIRDTNAYLLVGRILDLGMQPVYFGIVPDRFEELIKAIKKALLETDIVLLSGGTSMGVKDMVVDAINSLGTPGVLFHGLAIKPGKPTIGGGINGKPILGLPGHPASALMVFERIGVPFLRYLSGLKSSYQPRVKATLTLNLPSKTGQEDLYRVMLTQKEQGYLATPILGKSGLINTLTRADGYVMVPLDIEGLHAGEEVEVILF